MSRFRCSLLAAAWQGRRIGIALSLLLVVMAGLPACELTAADEVEHASASIVEAMAVQTRAGTTAQPTASQAETRSTIPRDPTPDLRPSETPSVVATPTPTPELGELRESPTISYYGYPCDPYSIAGVRLWFWENTVRWAADGSAVFFSQGPVVYGAAVDGAWARAVADASGRPNPRLPWHPRVRRDVVSGPMTYFDISPEGDRLVYATCAYREEAVTGAEQASAELLRKSQGYRSQETEPFVHGYELALVEVDGGPVERLTTNLRFDNFPAWSPDGTRIAYLTGQSVRVAGLVTMTTVGHRQPFFTGGHLLGLHPPQWSPDGTRLAVVGTDDSEFRQAVLTVGAAGGDLRRLGRTISGPSWSPDGQRLAFVGATDDESDGWGLLTMAADGTDVRRVPLPPGWEPHYVGRHVILTEMAEFGDGWIPTLTWSPAGDHLLYTCGRRICVVGLDGTPVGRSPIEWWSGSVAAWSPRGTRIAVAAGVHWDGSWLNERHNPALYTMAPDGTDVRVLAEFDAEGELRPKPLQAPPAIVAAARCQAGVAVADPSANRGLVQDCAALLRVQAVWAPQLNWSTDRPMSDWVGVASSGSPPRVRELDVSGRGLRGPILAALGQVTNLRYLDLSHNLLTGPIPAELSQLAGLREVRLAGNQFTGCVPAGLPVVDREELELPDCEAGV